MQDVEVGEDAPGPVDLGEVPVDLGGDEEDDGQGEGDPEARDQGVCLDIDLAQPLEAADVLQNAVRKLVELWDEGLDGEVPAGAILDAHEYGDCY